MFLIYIVQGYRYVSFYLQAHLIWVCAESSCETSVAKTCEGVCIGVGGKAAIRFKEESDETVDVRMGVVIRERTDRASWDNPLSPAEVSVRLA